MTAIMLKIWTPKAEELASPLTYKYKYKCLGYLHAETVPDRSIP